MQRLREYAPLAGVFCLAVLVRIIYNVTVARDYVTKFDAGTYYSLATHLVAEHCFCLASHSPTTGRAPLWPFVMAIIYTITGTDNFYARLFLCFLGAGTCIFVYLLARAYFGQRIALITGCIAAIYTGLFIYDGWLYSESLYTFLLTAFCYTLYKTQQMARQDQSENVSRIPGWRGWIVQQRWAAGSGILLALASLTRPNGLSLLGLVVVWAIILVLARSMSWHTALTTVLVIALLASAIVGPWTLRNYNVTKTFIPIATGSGKVLSGSYNDTVLTTTRGDQGMWMPMSRVYPPVDMHGQNCCDYTGEVYHNEYAKQWILSHISAMPYLLSLHFINMWKPYTSEEGLPMIQFPTRLSSQIVWNMMISMPIPIYILSLLGLLASWQRRKQQLLVVYLVILLTIAQNIVFYGSSRFRAPIEPLLVLLTGAALWWLSSRKADMLLRVRLSKSERRKIEEPSGQTRDCANEDTSTII